MTEDNAWERTDLVVGRDIATDFHNAGQINFCLEPCFDIGKKFDLYTDEEDGPWLELNCEYDPYADDLKIGGVLHYIEGGRMFFSYYPTERAAQLIKDLVAEKLQEEYHQTPQEFCEHNYGAEQTLSG